MILSLDTIYTIARMFWAAVFDSLPNIVCRSNQKQKERMKRNNFCARTHSKSQKVSRCSANAVQWMHNTESEHNITNDANVFILWINRLWINWSCTLQILDFLHLFSLLLFLHRSSILYRIHFIFSETWLHDLQTSFQIGILSLSIEFSDSDNNDDNDRRQSLSVFSLSFLFLFSFFFS